jgi:hypothetical protein
MGLTVVDRNEATVDEVRVVAYCRRLLRLLVGGRGWSMKQLRRQLGLVERTPEVPLLVRHLPCGRGW